MPSPSTSQTQNDKTNVSIPIIFAVHYSQYLQSNSFCCNPNFYGLTCPREIRRIYDEEPKAETMSSFTIKQTNLPFLFQGGGNLTVALSGLNPAAPLPPDQRSLTKVKFGAAGQQDFVFGRAATAKLKISAGAHLNLRPIWSSTAPSDRAVLEQFGLLQYQESHADRVLLFFDTGAQVSADFKGSFQYSLLTASVELSAAADARFQYLRALDDAQPAGQLLLDYFSTLRLPAQISSAPAPGEAVSLEYNGELGVGAGLSIGYALAGSPDFSIGGLKLTEKYDVKVAAGVTVGGSISGRFRIQVGSGVDCKHATFGGQGWDRWAHVTVHKGRGTSLSFAANVDISATSEIEGLPNTADEFLGAALGVNARSWLNLADRIQRYSDPEKLKNLLDSLAKQFIREWTGKTIEQLDKAGLDDLLAKVHRVVEEYQNVDQRTFALFDRYFEKLEMLEQRLESASRLGSWDQLRGNVDAELWSVVEELTDGDTLGWMGGFIPGLSKVPSLPELQSRAQTVLGFLKAEGHEEIKGFVATVKEKFGLDPLVNALAEVDTLSELRAIAETRAGAFVERFTGQAIDQISSNRKFRKIRASLDEIDDFKEKWYSKLTEAVDRSFSLQASYAYAKASDHDALVEVLLDLSSAEGRELMAEAAKGNFERILANAGSESVRVLSGTLTDSWSRQKSFQVNILGWHDGWRYEGFDKLLVETQQRIVTTDSGALLVYTQADLKNEKQRIRNGERMYTSFLLRLFAETGGVVQPDAAGTDPIFDEQSRRYLIDTITSMAMVYDLIYEDPDTKEIDLRFALSFAQQFGLAEDGVTFDLIEASLARTTNGDFGWTQSAYTVRFAEEAARSLFLIPIEEDVVRATMRRIVLANYAKEKSRDLAEIGWAYASDAVFGLHEKLGFAAFTNPSARTLDIDPAPFGHLQRPRVKLRVSRDQLRLISTLYTIEQRLVDGFGELSKLLTEAKRVTPRQLQKRLKDFGKALDLFDDFDRGPNTIFAVFDQLLRQLPGASAGRRSTLELQSRNPPEVAEGDKQETLTKRFVAGASLIQAADTDTVASAQGAAAGV